MFSPIRELTTRLTIQSQFNRVIVKQIEIKNSMQPISQFDKVTTNREHMKTENSIQHIVQS